MKAESFLIFLFASQYIYLCSCQCDTESKFQCNNETCIPKTKLCNGISDCSNSEDEANCDFQKCGQSGNAGNVKQNNLQSRIVGGVDAVDGAWPWHALITRYSRRKIGKTPVTFKDRYIIGGASLINNYWVLTAAHVFGNSRIRLSNYIITLGISKKPDRDEELPSSAQMFWPGKIVKYPDYSTQVYNNDIALIKLGVEIDVVTMRQKSSVINGATYSYFVRPVCLPCGRNCMDDNNFVDKRGNSLLNNEMTAEEKCSVEESILYKSDSKVVVTGFGNTRKTDLSRYRFKPSIRLQEATLKILDKYKCILGINSINEVLGGGNIAYSDKYICCNPAESKKGVDACQGDSGGPVVKEVVNEDTGEPCWVQVGIVSFGYGCGLEFPGFYSNVAKFVGWINSTISIP